MKLAGRLGAAPSQLSFGDSVAQAGARPVEIGAVAGNGLAKPYDMDAPSLAVRWREL